MKLISIILLSISLYATQISLNFQNLKIEDFIKMVAKITDKNILLTTPIQGDVNFISVKPVNEKEIYTILLNILHSKGYTIINQDGYLKVIKTSEALREAPSLNNNEYQIHTTIIKLKNILAREVYTQVSYLKSRYGKIVANNDKNLLIITDYPNNLKTIKELISKIDTINKPDMLFYNLKNTQVTKILQN